MKKIISIVFVCISIFYSGCQSDLNSPVHEPEIIDTIYCSWIVFFDHWNQAITEKSWSLEEIYLEDYNIHPQIAMKIYLTLKNDEWEATIKITEENILSYIPVDTAKIEFARTDKAEFSRQ